MDVRIVLFTRHDIDPLAEFPHEYSDWVSGTPVLQPIGGTDLSRRVVEAIPQTRTVTTQGLHGASAQSIGPIAPPRYPPIYVCAYDVDTSVVPAIAGDARFYILALDAIGDGDLPPAMQGRGWTQPIPADVWDEFIGKLVAVTRNLVGDEQADHVDALAGQWRTANPNGTPEQFINRLRMFMS